MNDLELFLSENKCDHVQLGDDIDTFFKLQVLMYADDTAIFANDAKGLQKALDELPRYSKAWKLEVNSSKTKITIFEQSKPKKGSVEFTLNQEKLEIVNNFTYLGILFSFNGCFLEAIKRTTFSLISRCIQLSLPIDIKQDLFDKIITPIAAKLYLVTLMWSIFDLNITCISEGKHYTLMVLVSS